MGELRNILMYKFLSLNCEAYILEAKAKNNYKRLGFINFGYWLLINSPIPLKGKNKKKIRTNNSNGSLVPAPKGARPQGVPRRGAILYYNTDIDKLRIFTENKGKAGIYMWKHKESGKIYVGPLVDLSKRLRLYFYKSNFNHD